MNNQILLTIKEKINDFVARGTINAETLRNVLKEELQFYVLNFIYHHPEYSDWIMYGGSALRICRDLDRMSVDLDFEVSHPVTDSFLNELKKEVETHFKETYNADSEILTIKITTDRGLRLCFLIGDIMGIKQHSKQVHVKIDLNHFVAPKTVIERVPINRNQLSFVIKTYNMSSLMASKIAAILLRGQRGGLGGVMYEEKGRDIYDLLWYMTKRAIPDLDYLNAKGIGVKDLRTLFDKLTLQMNKVSDTNLKGDLTPLFVNQTYIENWLKNWRESYMHLRGEYKINTITTLESINIHKDFRSDMFSFVYWYKTEDGTGVEFNYNISNYWFIFREGDLTITIDEKIKNMVKSGGNGIGEKMAPKDKLMQYATLFNQKNENYLKKTNRIILGDTITTKFIRMTAEKLNQAEQILLDKSTLLSCELEDLLK